MENSKEVLDYIISRIEVENRLRLGNADYIDTPTISADDSNYCILSILDSASSEFDLKESIKDDEHSLCEFFGEIGYNLIKEFEKGGVPKGLFSYSCEGDYSGEGDYEVISSSGSTFYVQLSGGDYLPQMGCLISCEDDTGEVELEHLSGDISRCAEQFYKREVVENLITENDEEGEGFEFLTYSEAFPIGATSYYQWCIEKSESGRFKAYISNTGHISPNDYASFPEFDIKYFNSENDLNDFLNSLNNLDEQNEVNEFLADSLSPR